MKRLLARIVLVSALVGAGLAVFAAPAAAQDDTRASVSVGAAFLKWVNFTGFTTKGVAGDFVKPVGKMPEWGIVGDVGFYKAANETDSSFLGGVRYGKKAGRSRIFGQFLVGGVHWSEADGGSDTGFAFVPGGGIIVRVTDMVGIKGQVDYFVMHWNTFADGNLFRYWFGVDIKLGKK